jgi:hypothetical protein
MAKVNKKKDKPKTIRFALFSASPAGIQIIGEFGQGSVGFLSGLVGSGLVVSNIHADKIKRGKRQVTINLQPSDLFVEVLMGTGRK